MMKLLRPVLTVAVLAAIYLAGPNTVRAAEGPWCAVLNFGSDVTEDCQYQTLQECLPAVTAGFRGFCNMNPRWQGATAQPRVHGKRASRRP